VGIDLKKNKIKGKEKKRKPTSISLLLNTFQLGRDRRAKLV